MFFSRKKSHADVVAQHYQQVWASKGRAVEFSQGPVDDLPDGFKVLEFAPHGERSMWTYATCGMSQKGDVSPIELHLFSPKASREPVELLYATAHFHRKGTALDLGHTVDFGKPWIDASPCEYGLISLPIWMAPIWRPWSRRMKRRSGASG